MPCSASDAAAFRLRPWAVRGLWMPGVSTNTTWASGRVSTPRSGVRVVWGLFEVIDTFCPMIRLIRVDLPELGRPASATIPQRCEPDPESEAVMSG